MPPLLLVDHQAHGLDDLRVAGRAGGKRDGAEIVEAQPAEEDVAEGPSEGGEDAALLLRLDDVAVDEVLGVAVVLVIWVCGEKLQVHVLGVAVEELGAGLVDDLGVGAEAGVTDVGLDLALCFNVRDLFA